MGHWGVRSYENDVAADALDAGFAQVHGQVFEDLMDDSNPLTPEQVLKRLASPATLDASLGALGSEVGRPFEEWDEVECLGYAGIVIRHAEWNVPIPPEIRDRALSYLKNEPIEWEEATARKLRLDKEIRLLNSVKFTA